jgi:integrase
MIELQRITGMRPAEACLMRGADLDTTEQLWVYRPCRHKTAHHGHDRAIYLGPRGRAIIEPFLKTNPQAYLFSPAEAETERRADLHAARKTPMEQGNVPNAVRLRITRAVLGL